ncbi:MAG: alpha/beta fold hydrolase [Verrucomicrobia bacterium]|nr:alpha/beta fold hydrolase [Verrucomicrobiota bacterium]
MRPILLVFSLALATVTPAATESERRAQLDWMLKNLPDVPTWREWQHKTGALPPDFDALPSANFLPDPFRFADGRTVAMPRDWPARRDEIKALYQKHILGTLPPKPKLDRVVPGGEPAKFPGYTTRTVTLHYGPEQKITSQVTLTLPDGPGPHPVLIGGGGAWTASLLRRGYAACEFPSSVDQETNLQQLHPGFDFATMAQRAWTVQLVVDYLHTVPEIDRARIALTGYSRGGKMALTAAAFDDRIAAVVAGSTGVGGVTAWRLAGERGMGEGVESTTRMFPLWFAPQLRFFAGHEDRLPVDANLLMALVAPRALLTNHGLNDEVANVWANEQASASALRVYRALGKPDALGLMRNPGFHGTNDIEGCIDWLDIQFGRSPRAWKTDLLYPWDFDAWKKVAPASPPVSKHRAGGTPALLSPADTRAAIEWLLGSAPTKYTPPAGGRGFGGGPGRGGPAPTPTKPVANPGQLAPDVPAWVIARNSQEFGWRDPERSAADSRRIRFGSGLTGDLYFPAGAPADKKLPAVVWLHGYSHPLGYMWVYRRDLHPVLALVQAGYAVLAFDQCGFGSRQAEIGPFYDRFPRWSQLGKMIDDTRAAIDALEREANVDAARISLFGYTLGANVALHAAALDSRVKSVVSVSGFTPWRTDTAAKPTGGLARFSVERPVVPRLGLFIGQESRVPYDYDDLLAAIAPRPVFVVQPTMDRDATPADVRAAVERARQASANVTLDEPHDYQRFPAATQARAIEWLKAQP